MPARTATRRKAAQADGWIAEMLAPVTARRNPYGVQRSYPEGPGRQKRIEGDQALLVRLEQACTPRGGERGDRQVTLAELGEERVRRIVEEVEELHWGVWCIEREPESSILEALDSHFLPLQEAAVELRRETEALNTRRAELDAETRAAQPGWPFDVVANGKQNADIWGQPTA